MFPEDNACFRERSTRLQAVAQAMRAEKTDPA